MIYRRQYREHPPRFEYHLTQAGIELRSILNGLRRWGDRWLGRSPRWSLSMSAATRWDTTSHCVACGERVDPAGDPREWSEKFLAPGWDRTGPTSAG